MATKEKKAKAVADKPAGFADVSGRLLLVGDTVRYQHPTSLHSGGIGTLTAIHPRQDSETPPIATVQLNKLDTWKEAPAIPALAENLTWLATPLRDSQGTALITGDLVRVLPDVSKRLSNQLAEFLGEAGVNISGAPLCRIRPDGAEPEKEDIILTSFLVKVTVAEALPEPPPIEEDSDLPFLNEQAQTEQPVVGLRMVPLASIVVTTNTRKIFDEAALGELAESVRAHGILQPIVLRPHGTEPGKYELVAGGRRYRAAQLAELAEVPATVRNLTDREFLEVQLLENLQRVDVRPADEAEAFSKLMNSNFSAEEIAQRVGKPVKFVHQRAKLVSLIPFWFELLEAEKLALVAAHELARLPAHSQLEVKHVVDKQPSYYERGYSKTDIRNIINEKVLRKLDKAPWDKADAWLVPSAGPCTLCPKRSMAQGVLFEMKEGVDLCLDAGCFTAKRTAFVNRRLAEVTADLGKAPVCVSSEYSPSQELVKAGVISYQHFGWSAEGTTSAVQVFVMDGSEAGQLKYAHFYNSKSVAASSPEAVAAEKKEQAERIRKERTKKAHRTLLAEALTIDLPLHLNNDGPAAHAVLAHFLLEELNGRAGQKLEYLKTYWGWEPTDEESQTGYDKRDEQGRTPWARYILRKASELSLSQKQYLYFTLKVRHRMDHEYEDLQFSIASIAGTYDQVAAEAEQAVVERYYSKGKKQEATA